MENQGGAPESARSPVSPSVPADGPSTVTGSDQASFQDVLVDVTDRQGHGDALRQADRARDEFLATLAHELRNPLAPLRNALHILQLEHVGGSIETRSAMSVIDRQLRHMSRLIDDLVDVSRITRDKLELKKERSPLSDMIQAAVEISLPHLQSAAIELNVNTPAEVLEIDADATRLAQAISNLLDNAAKFTARGGRVWLATERHGGEVLITVRDTGSGIEPDVLPRIFDMFTQQEPLEGVPRVGLGIGLTIARRIIELHGGSIEAYSDGPGQGSCFAVRLPNAVEAVPARVESHGHATPPPRIALRVEVVDDSRDVADTLAMLLRMTGNVVCMAHDGRDATRVAAEFRPDVMVLDIGLPYLSGYDVARWIRHQPWGQEVVLIATTGRGQEGDRDQAMAAGFDHHLVKPVDPTLLLDLLAALGSSREHRH
jgi:CheY-like chemotaxis protein